MFKNKIKPIVVVLLPLAALVALTAAALAQQTVPAPYAGMKNPNSWTDAATIKAGKSIYLGNCLSCHGTTGADVAEVDFSSPDTAANMEAHPDFYFYVVSEGIKDTEMASYKYKLTTAAQRWQVLTYIHSLGYVAPTTAPPPTVTPNTTATNTTTNQTGPVIQNGSGPVLPPPPPPPPPPPVVLNLSVPAKAVAGQPLSISLNLTQGNDTISGVPVTVYLKTQFFTNAPALATVDQVTTDENGTARLTFTPMTTGFIPIVAIYTPDGAAPVQGTSTVELTTDHPLYETQIGLPYKGFPPDIILFPQSAWDPNRAPGIAPVTVFRIPGGLPFIPFVAYLGAIILVWTLYVRVMYLIYRIVPKEKVKGLDLRLLPMAGMAILGAAGLVMVLVLTTGPYVGNIIAP